MKVVAFGNDSGSRYWRLEDPFKYLRKRGVRAVVVSDEGINDEICRLANIIVLQSCVDRSGIACAAAYQGERNLKLVVESDDLTELEETNPHMAIHKIKDAPFVIKRTMEIADMLTCTTPYLAERLSRINPNVKVLPNYMDMERWDLPTLYNDTGRIRIGWAGSITHIEDLKLVINPLKRIMEEFPHVECVFIGDTRIAEYFDGYKVETMLGVPFEVWPSKLHGLRLDIGIAPLRDTEFNRCKSNIKILEYGICSLPVVASDVEPYKNFGDEYVDLCTTEDEWYQSLKSLVSSRELRRACGKALYSKVKKDYDLSKHIKEWIAAYKSIV